MNSSRQPTEDPSPVIKCFYSIGGPRLDPAWIEDRTGLKATESRSYPIVRGKYATGEPHVLQPEWTLEVIERGYDIESALWKVLADVGPWSELLSDYSRATQSEAVFGCNVTITQDRPLYELSAKLMTAMARFGAAFLMDIYDYSE